MDADSIFGFVTIAMAVLGGIVSAHAPSEKKWKIAYGVGFLVFGCAGWFLTLKITEQNAQSQDDLQSQIRGLQSQAQKNVELQKRNNELQTQLMDMGRENTRLAKQSISSIIGGDSFCWMNFSYEFGAAVPFLVHSGSYPIYDVSMRIVDLNKFRDRDTRHEKWSMSDDFYLGAPELQPGRIWMDTSKLIAFSDQNYQAFNVFFSARNGMWNEELRIRKVGSEWRSALRVISEPIPATKKGKKLFEQVAKDFPTNEKGEVDWIFK